MPSDKVLFTTLRVLRSDQARAKQLFPKMPFSDVVKLLLDRYQAPQLLDADHNGNCANGQAHAHLEACPLRAFPVEDLRKYPLTLDRGPQEVQI